MLIKFWLIRQMNWSSNLDGDVLFSNRACFDLCGCNMKSVYSNQLFNFLVDGKILKFCFFL